LKACRGRCQGNSDGDPAKHVRCSTLGCAPHPRSRLPEVVAATRSKTAFVAPNRSWWRHVERCWQCRRSQRPQPSRRRIVDYRFGRSQGRLCPGVRGHRHRKVSSARRMKGKRRAFRRRGPAAYDARHRHTWTLEALNSTTPATEAMLGSAHAVLAVEACLFHGRWFDCVGVDRHVCDAGRMLAGCVFVSVERRLQRWRYL
jgi:hypothetical protein